MARKKKGDQPQTVGTGKSKPGALQVEQHEGEKAGVAVAHKLNGPFVRHGVAVMEFQGPILKGLPEGDQPDLGDYLSDLQARGKAAAGGDLETASQTLVTQALTLDCMFTELARRGALNMGHYPDAAANYMRLAFKAQAQSRATLEALAKLHQPREQTVRHVHVNEGGQAIVADQFHHHTGGSKNVKTSEQSHATGAAGASAPMLGKNPQGDGVPIASGEGAEAVPDARRD
ncbi:hypothetical protein [Croceicoccus sp. Ery15]|uniref:hypothetical protein n=1 Tax=Croceicoccus sp. Ery15 TaxID=1703338 RepID=UPI001E5D19B2|nr:hypothetical protein [Croceicoccus sp. Ery15]